MFNSPLLQLAGFSIVSKLAFMPPEPSYKIDYDPETKWVLSFVCSIGHPSACREPKIHLLENRAEWPHGADELRNVEIFFTRTRRNNNIACMFIRPCAAANFTIIFSHGNAVDLGL